MSDKTSEVWGYVCRFYINNGYMPSVRQIGRDLFIHHNTAHYHMKRLEEIGYIRYIGKVCIPVPQVHQLTKGMNHHESATRIG